MIINNKSEYINKLTRKLSVFLVGMCCILSFLLSSLFNGLSALRVMPAASAFVNFVNNGKKQTTNAILTFVSITIVTFVSKIKLPFISY